ncbi:MAG: thiamine/thiamine pyrophosphate ABC transporter permease ThiP [Roseobacter sp.]|nr:thiamine/thiamine pyrophosphate ABC transporter permease ThiP [Roseobacter sp.]
MARRAVTISQATSAVSAALVMLLVLAPIAAVALRAGAAGGAFAAGFGPADRAALEFTVVQAALSALLSAALAVPVARALARRQFRGRGALVLLMGAPFILPVIVAVMGLLSIFGQGGGLNGVLSALGLPRLQIYGLHGVVLAHVFFNLPLATRLLLQGWDAIPQERFRLVASLGMGSREVFRVLEWPMLKERLPAVLLVIFLICLSSFAVALTLGGGPAATTLELAIYQAFHLEFDLVRAALLALVQLALVLVVGAVALRFGRAAGFGAGRGAVRRRWDADARLLRGQDALVLSLAAAFIALPLAAVALRGAGQVLGLPASVWSAALTSVALALGSTVLCMAAALALAASRGRWAEMIGLLGLAISPLVLGAGLFLLVAPYASPQALALPVTMLVNALMALPFALRIITPEYARAEADYGRLAEALGLRGLARLRYMIWPQIRGSLGFAAGLAAALSMGDLGVIALFADGETATLPLQVYRLMGAYRMETAAGAALLLVVLSFGLFALFDWGGRRNAQA